MREIKKICSVSYFEQALAFLLVPIAFPEGTQQPAHILPGLYCQFISERLT